jgi:hypothetical protein
MYIYLNPKFITVCSTATSLQTCVVEPLLALGSTCSIWFVCAYCRLGWRPGGIFVPTFLSHETVLY